MNIQYTPQFDFSLGVQDATTFLLKQPNELKRGINLRFTETVGAFQRRPGFVRAGEAFATDLPPQGGIIAKFSTGSKRIVAVNNSGGTATILRVQDSGAGTWADMSGIPTWPVDSILFFKYYLDEVYVSGFDPATGDPIEPCNIDKDLDVSTTRNLLHAPWPYFFEEYLGLLYAGNVLLGGDRYKDRVYKSSPPLGAMTFMQGAQDNVYASETLVNQVPQMTSATAPFGVAAASSTLSSYDAWKAFARQPAWDQSYGWVSASGQLTGWLRFDFGAGNTKIIRSYSMMGDNNPSYVATRSPKTWTFQGSDDASSWTTLDTQTNVTTWALNEVRTYAFANSTPYRYYRVNVTANHGATDYVVIGALKMYARLEADRLIEFKSDSVRYLKAGDIIDVYEAGTETKKFTVTVNTVDKPRNTFTIYPLYNTLGVFNATTDALEFTSGQQPSLTDIATGDPIRFTTSGTMPTGLSELTTYYAIRVAGDDTKIRLALTEEQARINDYINFTSNGSGTFDMEKMYSVEDNDEIWLTGTKGRLNLFWNTDYPNEENAEFLALKPGTAADPQVTGMGASSNRLFLFTKNSGSRYDGNNLIVFNHSVGCISHRSIANIDDDWLLWVDAKGNVRARSENQGAQENISRAIRNPWMRKLSQEQLKAVSTGVVDQVAKFYLGQIEGEYMRVAYDFEANTWSPERLAYPALIQDMDDYTGDLKPYFFSSNGRLYMDETGDKDDDKNIAFEAGTGKDILGTPKKKRFYGILLFTRNCNGLRLQAAVDGGQMKTIGRIEGETCFMKFNEQGDNVLPLGVAIDWQIMGTGPGEAPAVDGAVIYWIPEEDVPSERRQ